MMTILLATIAQVAMIILVYRIGYRRGCKVGSQYAINRMREGLTGLALSARTARRTTPVNVVPRD